MRYLHPLSQKSDFLDEIEVPLMLIVGVYYIDRGALRDEQNIKHNNWKVYLVAPDNAVMRHERT